MLTPQQLHPYQWTAINYLVEHPRAALYLDPGLGKTIAVLTAHQYRRQQGVAGPLLVVAPLRVALGVWAQEAAKWSHTQGLKVNLVLGAPQQRLMAIMTPADVYVVNYENLMWLYAQLQHYYINRGAALPFDTLVFDESTRIKNVSTERFKALRPLLPYCSRRVALTGTPAPNGLLDLFGQYLALDDGRRLGESYADFKSAYFRSAGYNGYSVEVTPEGEKAIHSRVADITLEMGAAEFLDMPDLVLNDVFVDLPSKHRSAYEELERDMLLELETGTELQVSSAASLSNKLLQYVNGSVYTDTETRAWEKVHDAKLEALDSLMEESGGSPVLVAYNYRPDAARIMRKYPWAVNLTDTPVKDYLKILDLWVAGRIRLLIGHPASMGHGVDRLQHAGHTLVWFGLNWSLELVQQMTARLHRQGQEHPVMSHRILCRDTVDELVLDRLEHKDATQKGLREAMRRYRERRGLASPSAVESFL